jgi:hypothetical protein
VQREKPVLWYELRLPRPGATFEKTSRSGGFGRMAVIRKLLREARRWKQAPRNEEFEGIRRRDNKEIACAGPLNPEGKKARAQVLRVVLVSQR